MREGAHVLILAVVVGPSLPKAIAEGIETPAPIEPIAELAGARPVLVADMSLFVSKLA